MAANRPLGFKNLEIYEPLKISVNFYRQGTVNYIEIKGLVNS